MIRSIFILIFLFPSLRLFSQPAPAGLSSIERDSLVSAIKGDRCNDYNIINSNASLSSLIGDSTKVLRIYFQIAFDADSFTFDKEPKTYFDFDNEYPAIWLINNERGSDSVFSVAVPGSSGDCFLMSRPTMLFQESYFFDKLKPILNKVDLLSCVVFYMAVEARELLVMKDKEIYVIESDHLTKFNDFYSKRYRIEAFRNLFRYRH